MKKGQLVRVRSPGESSWAEYVKKDTYRSLNTCIETEGIVKLPPDHEFANRNGKKATLCWGHLFIGEPVSESEGGGVRVTFIIGQDLTPVKETKK